MDLDTLGGDPAVSTLLPPEVPIDRLSDLSVETAVTDEPGPTACDEAWSVAGERACVVGLGGLGRGIVDRLTGLGLDVDGLRPTPVSDPGVDRVYTPSELETAVADARFVVVAVPLTDVTRWLVDSKPTSSGPGVHSSRTLRYVVYSLRSSRPRPVSMASNS